MSSRKPDKAVELARKMLEVLESRRSFQGDSEPPSLQQLGELADPTASPEVIRKAATKKALTDRVAIHKVDKKPSLSAAVYFKEDVPRPEDRLARRMISTLEAQKRLGDTAYPPTLRRLAELCETRGPDNLIRKAAGTGDMGERTMVLAASGKNANLDAPIAFRDDVERGVDSLLAGVLRYALGTLVGKTKKGTTETSAFTPAEAAKRFIKELQPRIEHAVNEGISRRELPAEVGWVAIKGKPLLFLAANVQGAAPRTAERQSSRDGLVYATATAGHSGTHNSHDGIRDFAQAFRTAFESIDRRNGSTNFVKIAELREALPQFSRQEFDAGLRELRMGGGFSLDSHEGLHGSLSHDDREAGVREAGSVLVYASRR